MNRMWHKVNFWEKFYLPNPSHHEQDVTQGQFLRGVCIYPTPPPWAGCDTRSIFERSIIYPTPPPWAGCDTRSIFERSIIYPTPPRWAGCDTRSIFERGVYLPNNPSTMSRLWHKVNFWEKYYLPNPSTMSRMWHKVNFWEGCVFTQQPLHHEQVVTQGQFLREVLFTQPLHHEQDVTQGQFLREVLFTQPLSPWPGCYTRSIFERSMYLPKSFTINNKSRNIKITNVWWFYWSFKIMILRFLLFPLLCPTPVFQFLIF